MGVAVWRTIRCAAIVLLSGLSVKSSLRHARSGATTLDPHTLDTRRPSTWPSTAQPAAYHVSRSLSAPENLLTDDMLAGRWRRGSMSSVSSCNSPPPRVRPGSHDDHLV